MNEIGTESCPVVGSSTTDIEPAGSPSRMLVVYKCSIFIHIYRCFYFHSLFSEATYTFYFLVSFNLVICLQNENLNPERQSELM
jgi:hypothetical protein